MTTWTVLRKRDGFGPGAASPKLVMVLSLLSRYAPRRSPRRVKQSPRSRGRRGGEDLPGAVVGEDRGHVEDPGGVGNLRRGGADLLDVERDAGRVGAGRDPVVRMRRPHVELVRLGRRGV